MDRKYSDIVFEKLEQNDIFINRKQYKAIVVVKWLLIITIHFCGSEVLIEKVTEGDQITEIGIPYPDNPVELITWLLDYVNSALDSIF